MKDIIKCIGISVIVAPIIALVWYGLFRLVYFTTGLEV